MYRILIIDDEQDVLIPLSSLLQKKGFEVTTLSKGETTFKAVDIFKPDIILLDIKLDDYDGRDICWELKANEKSKMIKILLCSGYRIPENEYIGYGADDFIAKPFELKELIKKIKIHLNPEVNK